MYLLNVPLGNSTAVKVLVAVDLYPAEEDVGLPRSFELSNISCKEMPVKEVYSAFSDYIKDLKASEDGLEQLKYVDSDNPEDLNLYLINELQEFVFDE